MFFIDTKEQHGVSKSKIQRWLINLSKEERARRNKDR
jgi:hypothetical protein